MVANLIDNAVRHNRPNGWVQIATGTRGGTVFMDIANSGPAIADDQVPLLFEPFRRLGELAGPTGGTGLGLSIVRSVAAAHHGDVSARPVPSGGLELSVRMPVAAVASRPGVR
jgi:signal transduction histidine kinase